LDKIRRGTVYRATVDINPHFIGVLDLDFAIKLIQGQIVPNRYDENAILVTKENIKAY
jgi:ABC-type sugar transport system substrate-binding protein